jgi:uncharacterized membrane protein
MDFVLWISRIAHFTATSVWIGGLLFHTQVVQRIASELNDDRNPIVHAAGKRLIQVVWVSLAILLVSGAVMLAFSRENIWFDFSTPWRKLIGVKQAAFVLLVFLCWQMMIIVREMDKSIAQGNESFFRWRANYRTLALRALVTGLIAVLSSAALVVYQNTIG